MQPQINFITKIEGHGELLVDWSKNDVKLKVSEGERLFEGILVGRDAEEMHWITSRICGVCPIAHNLASLKTVENALGIVPNRTTILLRRLMLAAQIIQSHMLHFYFLTLPDYLGIDRATELKRKNPKAFGTALRLKEVSDEIAEIVAGRSVHPTTTTIGGFHKIPVEKDLKKLLNKLKKIENDAIYTAEIANNADYPEIRVDLEFVSQDSNNADEKYTVYDTEKIISSKKETSSISDYKKDISEEIKDYSTAKFGKYKSREVMVGALARLKIQGENLMPEAKKIFKNSKINFENPYHNNLAQAIEIVHFYEEAREIIKKLLNSKMDAMIAKPSKNPSFSGVGAVEAPRGGLYHEVRLDQNQKIIEANIITPTVQNLTSIEKSAKAVLEQTEKMPEKERERLLNMLVRAYDPCITCSVH